MWRLCGVARFRSHHTSISAQDPEIRLGFFSLLAQLIATSGESLNASGKFSCVTCPSLLGGSCLALISPSMNSQFRYAAHVVAKIVLPNVVWQNGRVPSALRTAACMCLWALFQAGYETPPATIILCISCVGVRCVGVLCSRRGCLSRRFVTPEVLGDVVAAMLPHIVSLMDDDSEDTRLIACRVAEQVVRTHRDGFTADFAGYDQMHSL